MGKAVNLMMSGKAGGAKNNENGGPTSTGKGGIPNSLKVKAAGTKGAPGIEKTVNNL
jgi:hypothetical protein